MQVFHHLLQRKLTSRCSVTENSFEHPGSDSMKAQLTGRNTFWMNRARESSLSTLEIPAGSCLFLFPGSQRMFLPFKCAPGKFSIKPG